MIKATDGQRHLHPDGPVHQRQVAIVEKSHEFTLVPWRPVIDQQLGREATGIVQGGSVSWQMGRERGLPRQISKAFTFGHLADVLLRWPHIWTRTMSMPRVRS